MLLKFNIILSCFTRTDNGIMLLTHLTQLAFHKEFGSLEKTILAAKQFNNCGNLAYYTTFGDFRTLMVRNVSY
jgi:hypothetical protein